MKFQITVPSRVHVTLVDLGITGYRRNGGIGFCIDAPYTEFEFEKYESVDLSTLAIHGFSDTEIDVLRARIYAAQHQTGMTDGLLLKRAQVPWRHTGLGVGTSTALACLEALFLINKVLVEASDLVRFSGRGGTSGIGVHGYFSGGCIMDVGRPYDSQPLMSSDDIEVPTHIPLALSQAPMPKWPIGLFTPPNAKSVSREIERKLFSSVLPLTNEDVFKTTYHVVFGIMAAIRDNDFSSFCNAVNNLQECAWKRHEIQLHGPVMQDYMVKLKELGASAVGLSSVGPTLYFLSADFDSTVKRIRRDFPDAGLVRTLPNNIGRKVTYA